MVSHGILGSIQQIGEIMIALLLLACFAPKHIGIIDIIENGVCIAEFGNHFHAYDESVCKGKVEGDKIKVK